MASSETTGKVDSWEANAEHWDETMGSEGNKYWQLLELPYLKKMVHITPGCKALDLATGNGLCARWLASEGASVVATDGSENMLEVARRRTLPEQAGKIVYQKLDVTKSVDFEALLDSESAVSTAHPMGSRIRCNGATNRRTQREGFDIVVMNMAIMDVETLDPLAAALPRLLKKDGV